MLRTNKLYGTYDLTFFVTLSGFSRDCRVQVIFSPSDSSLVYTSMMSSTSQAEPSFLSSKVSASSSAIHPSGSEVAKIADSNKSLHMHVDMEYKGGAMPSTAASLSELCFTWRKVKGNGARNANSLYDVDNIDHNINISLTILSRLQSWWRVHGIEEIWSRLLSRPSQQRRSTKR